jgi:adenylate cyclase
VKGPSIRVVVEQPGRQQLILFLENELVLGRDCEGLLLADLQVSRRHVRLRPVAGAVEVADLDSTNGVYLNGVAMKRPEMVSENARLLVGDTNIRLEFERASAAQAGVGRTTSIRAVDDLRGTSIDMVAEMVSSGVIGVGPEILDGRTTTIVFSDIESSTERATSMGDQSWFDLLERHNEIFRAELQRCGGHEVKSVGDGFMLTFDSVRGALRFTSAVQHKFEAADGPDLRVRMGLHTGEAIADTSGDLFGRHVNLAARVANLALGGQVMASLVVHEIAAGRDDVIFGPGSEVALKGFADLQTVYEVLWQKGTLA